MRVKKYLVNTIEEAESIILKDLGPSAMILSTRPLKRDQDLGQNHRAKIEVIAGAEKGEPSDESVQSKKVELPTPEQFRTTLFDLEAFISKANGDEAIYTPFIGYLVNKGISPFLSRSLLKGLLIRFGSALFNDSMKVQREIKRTIAGKIHTTGPILLRNDAPQLVALIGPQSSGKTTTLMKLALQYRDTLFKKVAIISHGVNRQPNDSKLKNYCSEYQLSIRDTSDSTSLLEALDQYSEQDLILIDTPGRRCDEALVQLSSLKGLQMHIVLGLDMNEKEALHIIKGYKPFDPSALIFTKLDQTTIYGHIYNLHDQSGIPISYLGKGTRFLHDLEIADPIELSDLILPSTS